MQPINKLSLTVAIPALLILTACTPPSPETLAKDVCDCFKSAKAKSNSDSQIEAIDNCTGMMQIKQMELRDIEKEKDMNDDQVRAFEKRFDDAYKKCNQ